jgi:hypothetical protein
VVPPSCTGLRDSVGPVKGIIFNLLQEVVEEEHGADTWDALLQQAELDGAFTSLGNYPDEWLARLVAAASASLGSPGTEVVRWFGRRAIPRLAERYPQLFAAHVSARSFLLSLNEIIHPEVRKIYPGADAPDFDFAGSTERVVVMSYRSRRRLCALAEGLIEGSAEHFREIVTIEHAPCLLRGEDRCCFRIRFGGTDR